MYGVWITYNGQSVLRVVGQLLAAGCWWLVVVWGIWGQRRVWECEGESGIQHTTDCESLIPQ